jgi:hypothetical protein
VYCKYREIVSAKAIGELRWFVKSTGYVTNLGTYEGAYLPRSFHRSVCYGGSGLWVQASLLSENLLFLKK